MLSSPLRVLILEDRPADAEQMLHELRHAGFEPVWQRVETEPDYLAHLDPALDLILADYHLPQFDGLRALQLLQASGLDIPFIIVSGAMGEEIAVEAMKQGVADYVLKDRLARLGQAVVRALAGHRLSQENRRATEAFRASEARLKHAQKLGQIGSWEFDLESQKITWSDQTYELYERDPALGQPTAEEEAAYYSPEQAQRLHEYARRAIEEKMEFVYDLEARLASGRQVFFTAKVQPVGDGHGRVVKLAGTVQDITERKRSEQVLRESEDRYRSLFERVPVGLYRTTPAGEIVNANPALVQMLGYPDQESLLQLNAHELYVDPEDRKHQVDLVEREGVVHGFEMQLRRHDGTVIWVWDTLRAVTDGEGRLLYFDGAMEDVTERKRAEKERHKLEAQLQQAQKLEAVGLLAGGIAHDFNNRLTVIQGNAQLAVANMGPSDPLRENLTSIERAAQGAAALTRQLLTFSRRQILQPELLDLNKLITDFAKMLGRIISEAIELQLDLASGAAGVCADPNALEQVLMNLVLNARDAMPEGGILRMATATVQVDEAHCRVHPQAKAGDYIRLTVADTGVGMDETVKERLFEPFFTTKEPGKGTGLGLSMVYGIVRQHDGWIEVDSAVGEGTTFQIFLPVAQKTVHEAPQRKEAVAQRMVEKTILLAEDEQAVQEVEQRMLEQLGHKVLVATDGEQAVEVFAANQKNVDLVILDAVMPKLSGPKAYASIRALRMDVPVLFVTGHSQDLARLPLPGSARVHLLIKPFGPRELAQKVGEALEEAARTSPAHPV